MHGLTPSELRSHVYRLGELHAAYLDLVEQSEGEVTEAVEELEEFLAAEGDRALEALCWTVREAGAMAAAAKAEKDRLAEVERRAKARKTWAEDQLRAILLERGDSNVAVGTFSLSLKRKPEKLVETSEVVPGLLPEEFQRVKVEADKDAIKKALKAKREVEGFELQRGPETVVIK